MHFTSFMFGVAAFSAMAIGAPTKRQSDRLPPLEITKLDIEDNNNGNTTLSFTLHDGDPYANATADCSGSWPHGTAGYPTGGYLQCDNSGLGWNVLSWQSPENFVLKLRSSFHDPTVGDPPYDYRSDFGSVSINSTNVDYTQYGDILCGHQKAGVTILAPITESIA